MLLLHSGRSEVEVAVVAIVRVLVLVVVAVAMAIQVLMMKVKALLRLLPLQPRTTRMDLISLQSRPDLAPNPTGLHRGRDYLDRTSGPSGGSLCI